MFPTHTVISLCVTLTILCHPFVLMGLEPTVFQLAEILNSDVMMRVNRQIGWNQVVKSADDLVPGTRTEF